MQTGDRIGRYELLGKLGEGGMAEVWKARNIALERVVAMKFLLDRFVQDRDLQQRFLNEARIQARLQHPNIVTVFDVDRETNRSYLVMDYIDGMSLDECLRNRQALDPGAALGISLDVLAALQHAHTLASGPVVHRDVKPSNILLDRQGIAKLADFGIAVVVSEDRKTKTGFAPGSVFYMSPEQIQTPRDIDRRSDIYSFGCVLYEMLTGRPPFGKDTDSDFVIKSAHVNQPPVPIRKLNQGLPFEVERVVFRALSKDRGQRFGSAAEFSDALAKAAKSASLQPKRLTVEVRTSEPGRSAVPLPKPPDRGSRPAPPPARTDITERTCPFCEARTRTRNCSSCGRDITVARKVCGKCKKMVPVADNNCWNCGKKFGSEMGWKIPLAVAIVIAVLLINIALHMK